jgi:glutamyl/glutaminyl-tRNA synthetase
MSPLAAPLLALLLAAGPGPQAGKYFTITVVDEQTGRGVPLVELRTVNHQRYFTDSNGVVAFFEPGLMGQTVFFHVTSHGYEFPKDGFGFRGKAFAVTEGGSARLALKRINIAERLYRVTGGGIYRDSVLLGRPVPLRAPVLNGQVLGSDSVVNAVYRGKVYWFWGDTNRPAYPLGNYHVPGATSALPKDGGLDPEVGIDLRYFVDDKGFARPTAQMSGEGPTWITGLVVLPDQAGREQMFAAYAKIRNVLEVYERGLAEFKDEKQRFEKVTTFAPDAPAYPGGHPFRRTVDGVEYVYFATPYPLVRVRADPEHLKRLKDYEAFTCLQAGSRLDKPQLDRGPDGALRYGWKKDTPAVGPGEQARLIRAGLLKPEEALLQLRDADSGKPGSAHGGSVYWNEFRKRWVMIAVQSAGTSYLGEVWYAESDTPLGPWVYARKVVTHDRYSFYNPKQHPFFDKDGGRVIFFEGTYTHTFSGNTEPTPLYDYNQVLYKLNLTDPRLVLPVAFYDLSGAAAPDRFGTALGLPPKQSLPVAFFALDRPAGKAVPVYAGEAEGGGRWLRLGKPPDVPAGGKSEPAFYALPADLKEPPASAVPLYEFVHQGGARRAYSTDPDWSSPGYRRAERPLCLVWRNPLRAARSGSEAGAFLPHGRSINHPDTLPAGMMKLSRFDPKNPGRVSMVRTRFAPSPTGYLHIGGVRTALFNWLFARKHGGQFILRIDDTDQQRNVAEALQPILDGFRWLGLDWDEGAEVGGPHGPYYQSQKTDRYQAAVRTLLEKGLAYHDYATPDELTAEREAAERDKRPFFYSRRWMAETPQQRARFEAEGRKGVVRLKMFREGVCRFYDHIRGDMEVEWVHEQDHVIQRADGTVLYNLASVVDDQDMRITHVIRAEEHLSNTPRQIFIAQGLGYPLPEYAHVPFVAEPGSKNKLSKRKIAQYLKNPDFKRAYEHGHAIAAAVGLKTSADTFNPVIVDFYKQVGYLPDAIVNYLVLLGWSLDDKTEFFTRQEMIDLFSLERVNKAPASFDPKKLSAFQDRYMQALPVEQKVPLVQPYLQRAGLVATPPSPEAAAKVAQVVAAAGDRLKVAGDVLDYRDLFVADDQFPYEEKDFDKRLRKPPEAARLVAGFRGRLASAERFDAASLERLLQDFVQAEGVSVGQIIHALRVAVTGKAVGFGLFETLAVLGKEHCLARIDRALARLGPG